MDDLDDKFKSGIHASGLTLDFRSNRINRTEDFFLAIICIHNPPSRKRSVEAAAAALKEPVDPNLRLAEPVPTIESTVAEELGLQQKAIDCTPTQTLDGSIVGMDGSDPKLTSAETYLVSC